MTGGTAKMAKIQLLLVYKAEVFRKGLAALLESKPNLKLVGVCNSISKGIKMARKHKPDILILDDKLFKHQPPSAIRPIMQITPNSRSIVLVDTINASDIFFSITEGTVGYISKTRKLETIVKSIALISEGMLVIDRPMAEVILTALRFFHNQKHLARSDHISLLSKQERKLLTLVTHAATTKEIADTLFITENTVKVHLRNILHKLHARTRWEAIVCAIEGGLTDPSKSWNE